MKEYKIWFFKLCTVVTFIFLGLPLIMLLIGAVIMAGAGPRVPVIEISDVIDRSEEAVAALYKEANNDSAKAIVVRIDSPGGAVAPSQEIYEAIKKLKSKKPIVVSMGSVAASGGLYAALGASKIFANRGTQTGSIGVIMQIPNYRHIAEKVGVGMVTVKSGALKDTGNPFREMTDDERHFLEETSSKVHRLFMQAVADGRNIDIEKVKAFADGRVILGSEAKELGLVDEFGDLYDAAFEALRLAKVELSAKELPHLDFVYGSKSDIQNFFKSISDLPAVLQQVIEGASILRSFKSGVTLVSNSSEPSLQVR